MTREEAIKVFNELLLFGKAPCKKEELEDLCKIVLSALEQEPTTKNRFPDCESCRYYGSHHEVCNYCYSFSLWTEVEPTTKNDLGVDCIDRAELLKAMDTWDKFGNVPNRGLIPLRTTALQDIYVLYVKYDDMVKCVKGMSSVTPQEPKTGHWTEHPHEWGDNWQYSDYECSICHNWAHFDTDFCPNCGAKMAESEGKE